MDGNSRGAGDLRELQFGFARIESLGTMTRQLDAKALLSDLTQMMVEATPVRTDIRWSDTFTVYASAFWARVAELASEEVVD